MSAYDPWSTMPEDEKRAIRRSLKEAEAFAKANGLPFRPWTEHQAEHGADA